MYCVAIAYLCFLALAGFSHAHSHTCYTSRLHIHIQTRYVLEDRLMEYPSQKRTRQDFPRNSLHWKQLTVACGTQGLYQATVQATDVRHSDWLCRGEGGWHSHPWQRRVALLRLLLLYMHYLLGRFTSWASVRFVCAQIRGTLASDALCCDSRSTVDPASYQIEYKG